MRYVRYISKRLVIMLFTILVASFLVFMLLRVSGVDPVDVMLGEKKTSTPEVRAELTAQFHLDESYLSQYKRWILGAVSGDLGIDYIKKQSVTSLIGSRLQVTLGLVVLSTLMSWVIAIPIGIVSALKKNTWLDQTISILMLVLTSTPGFLIAIIALVVLTTFFPSYKILGDYSNMSEYFSRIFVPSVCLAFSPLALVGRITRSSMIDQLKSSYIVTVKAKGLGKVTTIFKHAFHNGVIPVLTVSSMMIGSAVSGAVLVEQIFSLPGIGSLLVTAVQSYNFPVVQALILLMLIIYLVISLLVDILYVVIDPRVKLK